jgi:hypothetical protein
MGGKLLLDRKQLEGMVSGASDSDRLVLKIEERVESKTLAQLGAFWAAVLPQYQADILKNEGMYKSLESIKEELKKRFLPPRKRNWSDGSPIMVKVPHPERKNVVFEWHLEQIPSMSELSKDEMNAFMSEVMHDAFHSRGLNITIGQ